MGEATGLQLLWSNRLGAGNSCSWLAASARSWAPTWAVSPHAPWSPCWARCSQPSPGLVLPRTAGNGGEEEGGTLRVSWGAGHLPTTLSPKFRNCFTHTGSSSSPVTASKL